MLYPVVLPFQITILVLAIAVVAITTLAPLLKWKRGKTFLITSLVALVAFIPSCTGIMFVVDEFRFGHFEYQTYKDIDDFRPQRYLPTAATSITMYKIDSGFRARYSISEPDFRAYVDGLWEKYGRFSAVKREQLSGEGSSVDADELQRRFRGLGWKPLANAIKYHSPRERDGGGATYYFDADAGMVYQRTDYW